MKETRSQVEEQDMYWYVNSWTLIYIEKLCVKLIQTRSSETCWEKYELTCYHSYFPSLPAQGWGSKELCTELQLTGSLAICQGE